MKFSRDAALEALRPRLWNFVRSNARLASTGVFIENVWRLPPGRFEELIATHLGLLDLTGRMLASCEEALPRLPSSVGRRFEDFDGFVHGPVDWPRTQSRRLATATPTVYVCKPVERRYDTPAARLVQAALTAASHLALRSGRRAIDSSAVQYDGSTSLPINALLYGRSDSARLHLRHPKLRGLGRPRPPRGEVLRRLLVRRPELVPIAQFLDLHERAFSATDGDTLREVFTEHLLAPAANDDLFELLVAFGLESAFKTLGFLSVESTPTLWGDRDAVVPVARLSHPEVGALDIFWDRSLWAIFPKFKSTSQLRHIEIAAGMDVAPIRPDVTLVFRDLDAVFLIEAKVTRVDGVAAERRGIVEALAYLKDAEEFLSGRPWPRAGVVAWNATGTPPSIYVAPELVPDVIVAGQGGIPAIAQWSLRAATIGSGPQG